MDIQKAMSVMQDIGSVSQKGEAREEDAQASPVQLDQKIWLLS